MARFYSNENIPLPVVDELRKLDHDVLTSHDAGNANRSVPDEEVLAFAASQKTDSPDSQPKALHQNSQPRLIGALWDCCLYI